MLGIGLPLYLTSFGKQDIGYGLYVYDHKWAAGIAMFAIGGASILTSIPLLTIGTPKKHESVEIYNRRCANNAPDITCNLTAGQNGIGLAINF